MKRNEYFTEAEIKEQKKRRKIGRRAMALLLAGMMLFSNIPSNVSAVSDNDISMLRMPWCRRKIRIQLQMLQRGRL